MSFLKVLLIPVTSCTHKQIFGVLHFLQSNAGLEMTHFKNKTNQNLDVRFFSLVDYVFSDMCN